MITYDVTPEGYRHWVLTIDPPVAILTLAGEDGGVGSPDGTLSSLLRVDIELSDALQRLRFEHPDVGAVVVTGGVGDAFCTGIPGIPPGSAPDLAANVWTFRNEVRCAIEEATAISGQRWLTALNGPASGAGYELALATDEIVLVDDGRSAVAFPEVTCRGELPATGGLIRLLDKRRVRPDLVDAFCCRAEGVAGQQAVDWGLVDLAVPEHRFTETVRDWARSAAGAIPRGPASEAVQLTPLRREDFDGGFAYPNVRVELDRNAAEAALIIAGPANHECFAPEPGPKRLRSHWWPLAVTRELDDALLRLRSHRPEVRSLVLRTEGDPLAVASADVAMTSGYEQDWFVREVVLSWRRTLKRLDVAWQSVVALVEPGSCFVGTLLELALAADRAYMVEPTGRRDPGDRSAEIFLTGMNFGLLPGLSGLTRLEARLRGRDDDLAALAQRVGEPISAGEAAKLGLATAAIVEAGWKGMIRREIELRAGLPVETRAALAATVAAAGPETVETKIFSRGRPQDASGTSR